MERARIRINGIVQGVGFRPFIHRLVSEHKLNGMIRNNSSGVEIELDGERSEIERFVEEIPLKAPGHALIRELKTEYGLPCAGYTGFTITESEREAERNTLISPVTDAGTIRLSTAPTAGRALPSCGMCRMTGRILRWQSSPCALTVKGNTGISSTDDTMHSQMPVLSAGLAFCFIMQMANCRRKKRKLSGECRNCLPQEVLQPSKGWAASIWPAGRMILSVP